MIDLTLYGRAGCHLCDEMKTGLEAMRPGLAFRLTEVDVGWQGELAERYGRRIPVLVMEGRELCHYFLDADWLRTMLVEGGAD